MHAALLLHYAYIAFNDLVQYVQNEMGNELSRGSILPMKEYAEKFIIRPDDSNVRKI